MPKVLDEGTRGFGSKSSVETNFMFLLSPFNTIFKIIGLIFAKSLYTCSFQIAFSIPLSNKVFIFSTNSKYFWIILMGNRLTENVL